MIAPAGLIALLLASSAPGPRLSADRITRVAGWKVHVRYDFFAEKRACRLLRPHIEYQRQALVFHLNRKTDTGAALYRIDNGPPFAARDDQPALARLGFLLHDDNLDNPSGGLVRIPEMRLADARQVRIATGASARAVTFDVSGFATAREVARKAGCDPETFNDLPQ